MSTKAYVEFSLFCLDLALFANIKKAWFLHTRFLHLLLTQFKNSKQNLKSPTHPFVDISK